MIPILYRPNEKEYTTNGVGALGDCLKCEVTQERNGVYELSMTYPVSGIHYEDIALRMQILADVDNVSRPQPFRVYEITRPINGKVKVYARHISYDLAGIPVAPFNSSSAVWAMRGLKSNVVVDCPFEFTTDKQTIANMHITTPSAIWDVLGGTQGGILDTYGGEYEFDRYTVKLHNARGYDRGVVIRYGKNLTDLEQEENCEAVYTGVYPFWASTEGDLVQLDEKIVNAPGTYEFTRIMPLDLSQEWEEAPTTAQLKAKAETYIKANNIGVPKVSLNVSFIQLAQSEEYKEYAYLEQVGLCDTVTVEFPRLGVSAKAKCVKTVWDCLKGRYDNIELGDARTNFVDAIVAQERELAEKTRPSFLQNAIMQLTASILGSNGGAVRLLDTNNDGMPDTLYIADNPDPTKAKKVWRFNYEGWGASQNGYGGPFSIGASFDSGLVADFITTGTLKGGLLKAGRIQDAQNKNYWDLESGAFRLSTDVKVGQKTITDAAVSGMTQEQVFNKLTDNGNLHGIYMWDGQLMINADYMRVGSLRAQQVDMMGSFYVRREDSTLGGMIGYLEGRDGNGPTNGIGVVGPGYDTYVICTESGVRIQSDNYRLFITKDGQAALYCNKFEVHGDLQVSGSITENANI